VDEWLLLFLVFIAKQGAKYQETSEETKTKKRKKSFTFFFFLPFLSTNLSGQAHLPPFLCIVTPLALSSRSSRSFPFLASLFMAHASMLS
jgi:hypothetical protein